MELLERTPYLDEMQEHLHHALRGEGQLLLIGGEAGSGKTALVERFCQLSRRVARVLIGACDPLSTPRPLGPLLDIASELGSDVEHMLAAGTSAHHLFRRVLDGLASSPQPTLLVIEDAHWADEATLDMIRFLARRIHSLHCLMIVTYRDDEVGSKHPFRVVMGDIATRSIVHRLALALLSEQAVARMAEGSPFDPTELYRLTGGNPFYVTEALAAREPGVPRSVQDAVLARASRLSSAARTVLNAAAVTGNTVLVTLLGQVIDVAEGAVEECVESGMLRAHGRVLTFRHELAREAIANVLLPSQRAEIHGRVLNALRSGPASSRDLAELAHHAEAAGDHEAILTYAPAAAEQASAHRAHKQAAEQYRRALRYAHSLPPGRHAELLMAFAYECYLIDQTSQGIEALQKAGAIWHLEGEKTQEGASLRWLSRLYWIAGRNSEAETAASSAITLLEQSRPGRDLAMAYSNRAHLRMLARDTDQAVLWGTRAIAIAEQIGDIESLSHALNNVGTAQLLASIDEGREQLERSLSLALAEGLEDHAARAYGNLGSGYGEIYQFGRATRYLHEGIAYCHEHDLDSMKFYMSAWLALVYCHQGRWSDSVELADLVLRQPKVATISQIMALVALGRVRARRGDPEVQPVLDKALKLALPTGDVQRIGPVRAARAEAAWLEGDRERAASESRAGLTLAMELWQPWLIGELGMWSWLAGDLESAPEGAAKPFARHMQGDWQGAADDWIRLGCPYEAARALTSSGQPASTLQALMEFYELNAQPAAAATRRQLREMGVRDIPRGPRPTTRDHPDRLTAREVDVLRYMSTGHTNAEIAASLYLSIKTVEHHASSIFQKMGVTSRREAVRSARDLSIISQDKGGSAPN